MLRAHTLGEALKLLLHRTRLKQDVFAQLAGVSPASASAYLNDTAVPSATTLRTMTKILADRLDVPADRLWNELGELLEPTTALIAMTAESRSIQ